MLKTCQIAVSKPNRKLRLTLVMSLYKTVLTGGEPPSSSLRVLRPPPPRSR